MLRSTEESIRASTHTLTRKDVAERLQLSPRTLSRMVQDGRLPRPKKIGRNIRWSEVEFESWLESQPRWGE
jgi:excisionase family DNA binding protein